MAGALIVGASVLYGFGAWLVTGDARILYELEFLFWLFSVAAPICGWLAIAAI